MSQEVIEVTEREVEIIEIVERGPVGPAGPQANINYTVVTSAQTLSNSQNIAADTSGGAFTLTLPASPNAGDSIDIFDYSDTFDTNNLTIARNGEKIESLEENLVCNVEGAYFTLIYTGATRGWQILPRYGTSGGGGEATLTTTGDMLYRASGANARLPIGTANQFLRVNSGATAPEWDTITKSEIGLGNVDNTSDSSKPISTATQTALNLKANLDSPALTGTPTAPTASAGTNTTQVATTAFTIANRGDRYLTTSTSSNSITTGSKTFTVQSGLSYTATQDITIVYDGDPTNKHMHGVVTSYSGTTLVVNVESVQGSGGPYTAWTINVGGLLTAQGALLEANNLSDVTNPATALTNIGGVPTSRTISAGTGLTGGGDLTANRTLTVSYGSSAGTACEGNDSRLSDTRIPTSHASSHASAGSDPVSIATSQVTSGTLVHERGGLEADVSAYNGLVKIASGSTSAVTVTSAGEALLDDADASAQRTTLGLGNSATLNTGTTAGTVAAGDHTHTQLHDRSHAITSASDHTATANRIFYSNNSGAITELALGAANTVLTSNGATSAPTFSAGGSFTTLSSSSTTSLFSPTFSYSGNPRTIAVLQSGGGYGAAISTSDGVGFNCRGGSTNGVLGTNVSCVAGGVLGIHSETNINNGISSLPDTRLNRDAANVFAQRNDLTAQESRLYATYTSSTNYQRMTVKSVKQTLSALSGASATTTGTFIPDGAVVVGVTTRVSTLITGATGYTVGDGTDADRWGDITGTAIGTTSDNRDWTAGTIECFTAGGEITLTAKTSNFTAGAIEICVFYLAGQAD